MRKISGERLFETNKVFVGVPMSDTV